MLKAAATSALKYSVYGVLAVAIIGIAAFVYLLGLGLQLSRLVDGFEHELLHGQRARRGREEGRHAR